MSTVDRQCLGILLGPGLGLQTGSSGDAFGYSVDIDGEWAIVGALTDNNEKGLKAGAGALRALLKRTQDDAEGRIELIGRGWEEPLGDDPEMTEERRGEMLFNDATLCFQRWQSCSSCHPDARADGLNWDLINDGIGNPKNRVSGRVTRPSR